VSPAVLNVLVTDSRARVSRSCRRIRLEVGRIASLSCSAASDPILPFAVVRLRQPIADQASRLRLQPLLEGLDLRERGRGPLIDRFVDRLDTVEQAAHSFEFGFE
jgi:hypothetical protein